MTAASRQRARRSVRADRGAGAPPATAASAARSAGEPSRRQGRGHLLITGTRPEGIVEVRDDLLPQLARLGGRQAAHGRIELGQVAADQPVIKRGAAH